MSDDLYFGKGLPGFKSNSRMGLINPKEGGSVSKYINGFESKSDAFRLGTAVHQLVLERDNYKIAEVTVPSDGTRRIVNTVYTLTTREDNQMTYDDAFEFAIKLHNYYKGNPGEKRTKSLKDSTLAYYDYLCDNGEEGIVYLDNAMKEKCINALAAIDNNIEFEGLLNPKVNLDTANDVVDSYNEYVMTCSIKYRGVIHHLKLKMDNFTVNHTTKKVTLNDLKTTSSRIGNFMGVETLGIVNFELVPMKLEGSFQKFHYYRQMYMYSTILKQWVYETFGDEYELDGCNMLVVETAGFKPEAKVFGVSDHWMKQGKKEFEYLLGLIHDHETGGRGLSDELAEIDDSDDDFSPSIDDLDELDDLEEEVENDDLD